MVAVKVLTNARSAGGDRWLGEARATAAVQHRNVVRVLDCGQAGDEVFIVMELAEGPTLAHVLHAHGPLSPQRAVAMTIQILEGLAAAHARGIVHRDIKPPNILVTRDADGSDFPKILDFGVSKQLTSISGTLDGTAIGTPGYMAPELFGSAKYADPRADIYAVAATLYEMLSGRLPFAGATYEEFVVKVATERPVSLLVAAPFVPPPIAAVVDRGLARDRDARWQSADEFAAVLRGALLGVSPPSSGAFEPTLHAGSVSSPPMMPPSVPSTLRTAPPPVVNTANRRETTSRGVLPWVLGVVLVMLAASSAGGVAVWRFSHAHVTPAPAAIQASAPPTESAVVATAATTSAATLPASSASLESVPSLAAAKQPPTKRGVRFVFPPKVTGQVRPTAVDALAQRIAPQVERCRGSVAVVTHTRLFVQADGTISIAQAAHDDGDDDQASECIGALFKDAANPRDFAPGGGGIVVIEARLDPR